MEDSAKSESVILSPDLVFRGAGVLCEVYHVLAWPSIQEKSTMLNLNEETETGSPRVYITLFLLCACNLFLQSLAIDLRSTADERRTLEKVDGVGRMKRASASACPPMAAGVTWRPSRLHVFTPTTWASSPLCGTRTSTAGEPEKATCRAPWIHATTGRPRAIRTANMPRMSLHTKPMATRSRATRRSNTSSNHSILRCTCTRPRAIRSPSHTKANPRPPRLDTRASSIRMCNRMHKLHSKCTPNRICVRQSTSTPARSTKL